jgi:uncharacterized protein YndB with AHSA1/START domain
MNGTLEKKNDGRFWLRFERSYPHRCEDVWRALIEPESLAEWFPTAIEGERRAGAELRFVFPSGEGPVLSGAVRVFEPPRLLEYSWDTDVLRWELTPTAEGCSLVFTTSVQQRSVAARDATGWHACLDNLAQVVDGQKSARAPLHFEDRYAEYIRSFGLGAFPSFLAPESSGSVGDLLPNAAVVGSTFSAAGGARMGVLRAMGDGETREHQLDADAYVFVIEGELRIRLGEQTLTLPAGTEFHVPGGGRVSGSVKAGTRFFYARAGATRAAGG